MNVKSMIAVSTLALSLLGGASIAMAPAASADATSYQIKRSTLSACQAEFRTAVKQLVGQVGAQYPCQWNKYQQAYIGTIVYNY